MLNVRLPPQLEARLNKLAKKTGRPRTYYAKQAIAEFLEEQEDYLVAISRLENRLPAIRLNRVARRVRAIWEKH